jgi:hypothetical protein
VYILVLSIVDDKNGKVARQNALRGRLKYGIERIKKVFCIEQIESSKKDGKGSKLEKIELRWLSEPDFQTDVES